MMIHTMFINRREEERACLSAGQWALRSAAVRTTRRGAKVLLLYKAYRATLFVCVCISYLINMKREEGGGRERENGLFFFVFLYHHVYVKCNMLELVCFAGFVNAVLSRRRVVLLSIRSGCFIRRMTTTQIVIDSR